WDHRSENAEKEPADFLERRQTEIVDLPNALWRSEIGSQRDQYHERLAPAHAHCDESGQTRKQKKEVLGTAAAPLRDLAFTNGPFACPKINEIENKKDGQNNRDRDQ